jgi:predicted alpha/beta hydrolase family esterase
VSCVDDLTILLVPGLRDHVANHWQTYLAGEIPNAVTVAPLTEQRLSRTARVEALDAALQSIEGEVVIVAHSAGVLMVAHWALAPTRSVRGALLATPADVERPLPPGYPSHDELEANGWLPTPRVRLPFPSILAASGNDPLCAYGKAAELADAWGSELLNAGRVGHLNPASGYGPWPEARGLVDRLAFVTC